MTHVIKKRLGWKEFLTENMDLLYILMGVDAIYVLRHNKNITHEECYISQDSKATTCKVEMQLCKSTI